MKNLKRQPKKPPLADPTVRSRALPSPGKPPVKSKALPVPSRQTHSGRVGSEPAPAEMRISGIPYRHLFENAPDGILLLYPATRRIIEANRHMVRLLGYSREDLIGKELFEIGFPRDKFASQRAFRKLKREREIRYEDLPLESKTGVLYEVEVVASLHREGSHSIIQCKIRDIAQRKHTEIALNRLASIVAFSEDAIIAKDTHGIITDWNRGAERIFGYTSLEMVGTSIMRLIPPGRHDEEYSILKSIKNGRRVKHFETVRKTRDGRLIDVSVAVSPIKDSNGKVVGASKVARDISERRREEESRRRISTLTVSNRKLEDEIIRREALEKALMKARREQENLQEQTKRLAQQALRAQEAERLRVSHELHDLVAQSLIGVNVRLTALVRDAGSPSAPDFMKQLKRIQGMIENSVETVHGLSENLRPLLLDDLGLTQALRAYLKTFMADTGIRARLAVSAKAERLENTLLTVLYRVAQEALSNVAKHSRARTVEVTVQMFPDRVSMTLVDDGQGSRVEPFLKAKQAKRLGLVGMRERVEMVGGTLEVDSREGLGTKVTAHIPLTTVAPSLKP
jgi:PAS domain S-box-containing protein